jgi:uroporphyrinogen decarboxylase
MNFQPDFNHMLSVLKNERPERLPVYEHIINPPVMEKILDVEIANLVSGDQSDLNEFFTHYCRFFKEMTYDTVSYEVCITEILPDRGALLGGRPGPIQNRDDFEKYPWDELTQIFWELAKPRFDTLAKNLPEGMKAVGGVGNGVFEISEDLVGFEYLCYLFADDPQLFSDLYQKIGDLMVTLWQKFLQEYPETFVVCRFGDDLGFKTSTLLSPNQIRESVVPQYKRVVDLVHSFNKPFLWHSCGNIFEVMDDVIEIGINAKHSNEDIIAPFDKWISLYNDRIGLLGGIDVDILCKFKPSEITEKVFELGQKFRTSAKGYALGSGNSIPDYIPADGYLAMIEGAQKIRENEIL